MDMLIGTSIIIITFFSVAYKDKLDKMDGWLIGTIGGLVAGAVIHLL